MARGRVVAAPSLQDGIDQLTAGEPLGLVHVGAPYELGYGRSISFSHDFIGRDALLKAEDTVRRTKVTPVFDPTRPWPSRPARNSRSATAATVWSPAVSWPARRITRPRSLPPTRSCPWL